MRHFAGGVATQFINDIDPYAGKLRMPLPVAVETDSEAVWQDFQDTAARMDSDYAATDFDVL